jgi:Tfp pilus tip-associated adhesin PilY1
VTPATLYRKRDHVLGDIINGAPVYVGKPPFSYADAGYADFAATSRTAMIYAAANDGMLHAFDANGGEEAVGLHPQRGDAQSVQTGRPQTMPK